jgi:hypothetical protein
MDEYYRSLTNTQRILAVMGGEWMTGTFVAKSIRISAPMCTQLLLQASQNGLVWRRETPDGTYEYKVKPEVRDSIRQLVSSRIRVQGRKKRRRKSNAASSI